MKKLTGILIAAALVLAPMSASALEMMTDSNMKDVTGQAGVSIAIDDVVLYQESLADTTYWDTDGSDAEVTATSNLEYGVNISYSANARKLITIDAIYNEDTGPGSGLGGHYTSAALAAHSFLGFDGSDLETTDLETANIGFDQTGASALSIDVGRCEILSLGNSYNTTLDGDSATDKDLNVGGVVIGLPTVEIVQYHSANRRSIGLDVQVAADGSDPTAGTVVNAGKSYIDIEKSGTSKMAILGGTLEIAPH